MSSADYVPDFVKKRFREIEDAHKAQNESDELKKRQVEEAHRQHLEEEMRKEESKLRDQFAMAALTGLIADLSRRTIDDKHSRVVDTDHNHRALAIAAYCYADQMLEVRKK